MPVQAETNQDQHANEAESESNYKAQLSGQALRFRRRSQSPLTKKVPNADAQMKGGGQHPKNGKCQRIRIGQKMIHFRVGGFAVGEPALGIKMPADIGEGDQAGVALHSVEPVPYPRIVGYVGFSAYPYIDAVTRVEQHGEEDSDPFDKWPERNGLQLARDFIVLRRAHQNCAVGPEMFG